MTTKQDLATRHEHSLLLPNVRYTETQLVLPADMDYEQWHSIVVTLGGVVRASAWWIGDVLVHGEFAYGEMYAQAEAELGLGEQTLTNYVFTCRHVAPALRRTDLSFSHHSAVASLEPALQEQYLAAAVANNWSRNDLRDAIRNDGHNRRALQPSAGHEDAVAAVDAAAVAAGTVTQPTLGQHGSADAPQPAPAAAGNGLLQHLAAVEAAAWLVYEGSMTVDQVPQPLAKTFKAVPVGIMEQLGLVLGQQAADHAPTEAAVATNSGAVVIDDLVPSDEYPCTNDPPCAFVAGSQEDLWGHLRNEHGWQ